MFTQEFLHSSLARLAVAAACAAGGPAMAGQANTSFHVSVTLVDASSGTCAGIAGKGAPQVTCRPSVIGVAGAANGDPRAASVLGLRPETPTKVAGELVELNDENHYAWAERNYFAIGEYSSRLVDAGRVRYVEMTVTW